MLYRLIIWERKIPLSQLSHFATEKNLIQIIDFDTWSRVINGTKKESLIDHIYVNDINSVSNVKFEVPTFGDHVLAIAELNLSIKHENKNHIVRNWKDYSIGTINNTLLSLFGTYDSCNSSTPVQSHWNSLENLLIKAIDGLAPLENHINKDHKSIPNGIKNLINKRKRLLKIDKTNKTTTNVPLINVLTKEIRDYYSRLRVGNVNRAATGPKGNLWRAVKIAKNLVHDDIPSNLTLGGIAVAPCDIANSFAKHFSSKVRSFVSSSKLDDNVYNGKNKLMVLNRNFMQKSDVKECIKSLPNKKCEGFDRIPVCVLKDTQDLLLNPLSVLFNNIYTT